MSEIEIETEEDKELEKYLAEKEKRRERAKKRVEKQPYNELVQEKIQKSESEALSTMSLGNMALVHNNSQGYIQPIQVTGDSKLVHPESNSDVAIFEDSDSLTVFMDMRNYWIVGGIIQKLKLYFIIIQLRLLGLDWFGRLKFNLYRVEARGEYTLPWKDLTPTSYKRRVEEYLKIANPADQGKALAEMARNMADSDPWWKNGMWLITILLIVFMFLYVMNGQGV
ncbi:MAG: hypothetical protein ACXACY_23475 [Candidatus Hodarchaeales archaeon]|jgi:hypothetical protein